MSVSTCLDLDAIVAAGWLDFDDMPREEQLAATAFYRLHEERVPRRRRIGAGAGFLVWTWTGRTALLLGSCALNVDLVDSDIDLGVGVTAAQRGPTLAAMACHANGAGVCDGHGGAPGPVYGFTLEDAAVEVAVLDGAELARERMLIDQITVGFSEADRIAFLWVKHLLRSEGRTDQLRRWKAALYLRFCPQLRPP